MTETRSKTRTPARAAGDLEEAEVTPLELFFDLVFVFALTQVTFFMSESLDGSRAPSAASCS